MEMRRFLFTSAALMAGGFTLALVASAGYELAIMQNVVPEFARRPFEPFSRADAVAIAMREWRLFGQPIEAAGQRGSPPPRPGPKPERLPGLWQRIGEYSWLGLPPGARRRGMTGKHDEAGQVFPPSKDAEHAWSAVFISYVMRIAGAGARFPYSDAHWAYIRAAIDASLRGREGLVVRAETLHAYSPQPGDLVCSAPGRVAPLDLDGFPAGAFPSHCDIVITAEPPWLTVIGGNVSDAVTAKRVPVTEDGKLVGPDGRLLDPDHPWFVIVRVLYDR